MKDTICALATSPGGALGIIRISGPKALEILSRVFTKNLTEADGNTIHYGHIKDGEVVVDEVLVSVFRAPHSYTGEESAEISCHGSRYILNKVLALLIENGCRQAGPGEFTQRAYLNGKMDLSQAEAVADLIASSNKATHQIAMSQLRGHFSSQLAQDRTSPKTRYPCGHRGQDQRREVHPSKHPVERRSRHRFRYSWHHA